MTARRAVPATLLALAVALGIFFRLYHLGEKLLWHDEVATRIFAAGYVPDDWKSELLSGRVVDVAEVQKYQHHTAQSSVARPIAGLAKDDPHHPPLYYVCAALWVAAFGDGIGTLRALSVLFSLLSLAGTYWLALELGASRRVAAIAVALSAVSPFFVLYAQEAREYSLWTLFIVTSSAALLRAIRATEQQRGLAPLSRAWALYAACVVLGLYTSFSMASVILAQLVYLAGRERPRLSRTNVAAFSALAVSAVAVVPWAINLVRHYEVFEASMRWSKEIVIPRVSLLRLLAFNTTTTVADIWAYEHEPATYGVVALVVLLVLVALVWITRRTPRKTSLLVLSLVLVPISMLLVPDLLFGGIRSISIKYLTPAWVGVQLALAFFLGAERPRSFAWSGLVACVFGVAIASSAANASKNAVWTKGLSFHLPEVAHHINQTPGALVVGNLEQYNPGNMLALSVLLAPGTKVQFLDAPKEERFVLPREYEDVYLYSPIGIYREALEKRENVECTLLEKDDFLELWKVRW